MTPCFQVLYGHCSREFSTLSACYVVRLGRLSSEEPEWINSFTTTTLRLDFDVSWSLISLGAWW